MKCPICDLDTEVIEVRPARGKPTRRRRQCPEGHRFSTLESIFEARALPRGPKRGPGVVRPPPPAPLPSPIASRGAHGVSPWEGMS